MSETMICNLDSYLLVNPNLVLREESDACALLFDPDSGRVHLLNPTAVAIWKQLNGRRSLREITALLSEEFDEMGSEAADQILALARSLVALGAIAVLPGVPEV